MLRAVVMLIGLTILNFSECGLKNDPCIFKEGFMSCKKHLPSLNYPVNITVLELYDISWKELNFEKLVAKFPRATKISIFGKNTLKILPPFRNNSIIVLRLNNLHIKELNEDFFENFTNLEVLSLKYNKLQELPSRLKLSKIRKFYLSGNRWNCSKDLKWILNLNKSVIADLENMTCHEQPYPGKPLLRIAHFLKDMADQCPVKCNCTLPMVVQQPETGELEPLLEVDCSHRGFTTLPESFPSETKTLRLETNEIESLLPLKTNPLYKNVVDLYLDNNRIHSIEELEGSDWLTHFRVFSLSGNMLTELPTYALDNALQQNTNMPNAVRLSLGKNPWRCDCVFTPVFQDMLQKYAHQIKDVNDVKCSYVEGDQNSLVSIVDLTRSSVCRLSTEYNVQILDVINAVLASLIILVLGKLAYDYYFFKKTGRLPWIVTKMP